MAVLLRPADFADLANAYLERAARDGVRHVEMFFDPQAHTSRGVALDDVVAGLRSCRPGGSDASRHLGGADRLFRTRPSGLRGDAHARGPGPASGCDRRESASTRPRSGIHRAPSARFSTRPQQLGLRKVAHAGEEGPPAYVWEALDVLGVERIDHGIRAGRGQRRCCGVSRATACR